MSVRGGDKGTGAETRIYPHPLIFTPEFGIKKSGYARIYTVGACSVARKGERGCGVGLMCMRFALPVL